MRADGLQELEQRPRTLRKLESIQFLVGESMRVAAHHVAHVELGHFVVGHVARSEARGDDLGEQGIALRSVQFSRPTYFLMPATAKAPAGSAIERVS